MTTLTDRATRMAALQGSSSRALTWFPRAALVGDTLIVIASMGIAVLGRQGVLFFDTSSDLRGNLKIAAPLIVLGWLASMAVRGAYRHDVFGAGTEEFKRVINSALVTAALVGVGSYLTDFRLSRGFFMILFLVGVPALVTERFILRRIVQTARRNGLLLQRVLIAGGPSYIDEIASVLRRESWLGWDVIGALTPPEHSASTTASGIPVVGNAEFVSVAVEAYDADVVFFAGGAHTSSARMREIVWELEALDVQLVVAPSMTDISGERINVRPVGGLPLIHLDPPTWTEASRIGKRMFDILGSLSLMLMMLPLLIACSTWIWLHDHGPILFRQTRVGRHGDTFSCLKFRSMVTDAEAQLARLHVEQGYEKGLFKMKDDPRITRPGKLLRRLSLDELPQLVNVLRGEMSLVGPRPPLPSEVACYEGHTARRLHVRPGLTGLWQVSGRSDLSWDEAIRLDLYYVDNWSMLADVNILAKTVGAVFAKRGAY